MTDELRNELRKKLIARKLQRRQEENMNQAAAFGGGVNQTLIDIAGFPVDIVNKGLQLIGAGSDRPVGGTRQLTDIARKAGLVKAEGLPETAGERAGRVVGASLPMFGLVGGLAKAGKSGGILAPMVEQFAAAPRATTAVEAVSAAGAAVGGEIGRQIGDEPELYKQIIGEIVGGITAPSVLRLSSKLPMAQIANRVTQPFRKGAQKKLASQILEEASGDRALSLSKAADFQALPGTRFTLAEKMDDANLIALEQAVAKKIPALQDEMLQNKARTNEAISKALTGFTGRVNGIDTKSAAVKAFHNVKTRLTNAMNARMAGAVSKMQEQIRRLRAQNTRPDISRIINDELEDALTDARAQERFIWDQLDPAEQITLRSSSEAFEHWIGPETPVPQFVRNFLQASEDGALKSMPFKDVKEFRTQLLNVQKAARSAGRADVAFFLERINRGVLDDIGQSSMSDDFALAVDFSRQLNERFTRGRIGKALRFAPRGGRAIGPEQLSEELFPVNPVRSSEGLSALKTALSPMPGAAETGRTNRALAAIEDLVKTRVFDGQGNFNESAAKSMLAKKGEFINQFPGLRRDMQNAIESVEGQRVLEKRLSVARSNLSDKRKTALGLMTNSRPDKFMRKLMNSENRNKLLGQAVKTAKKQDMLAFQGLQDGYIDELFKYGSVGVPDQLGNQRLSGLRLKEYFKSTLKDIKTSGLFDDAQLKRLNNIIDNAIRFEKTGANEGRINELLSEHTNFLNDFIIRVMGANLGGKFAGGNIGAPLVAAEAGSKVARKVAEALPQESLIQILGQAIRDENLYKELLTIETTPLLQMRKVQRLHSWLGALGIEVPDLVNQSVESVEQQ